MNKCNRYYDLLKLFVISLYCEANRILLKFQNSQLPSLIYIYSWYIKTIPRFPHPGNNFFDRELVLALD